MRNLSDKYTLHGITLSVTNTGLVLRGQRAQYLSFGNNRVRFPPFSACGR